MPQGYRGRRRDHAVRAAVLAACFVGVYLAAVVTVVGQRVDDVAFAGLASAAAPARTLSELVRVGIVVVLGAVAVVLGVVSALRRRPWPAVALAGATLVCAAASVLLRDVVLQRPLHDETLGYLHNTFPSTHVTMAAALGVAVVGLWPYRSGHERVVVRETVLASVVLACVVNVASFAHRPSDVLGSVLLVGVVTSVVGTAWPALVRPVTGGTGTGNTGTSRVRNAPGTAPRTGPRRARA